jgi:glycosyltransferase involved in cell wall biosynthesis
MRVLQINSVCGVGSTGRIATDIHNILVNQGHESYIAYGRGNPNRIDEKFTLRIGSKLDNYLHVAKTRLFDKHGLGSKKSTLKFIEKIKQLDFNIIHLHNIHGYYINFEILFEYLKHTDIPVVWTLHDCWAFTGHCAYFDYANCYNWKKECFKCPQKREYPKSILLDNSNKNFQTKKESFLDVKDLTIVTPSAWLADLVEQSFLKDYPINVINNGIDLDVFKPNKSNFRQKHNLQDKFIILGVASIWSERKGLKYFVELSACLSNQYKIVLVGLSNKEIRSLPANILGISHTNSIQELSEIYSTADVFVNPTLEDNFPTTNLEALACGTPVVTFNSGGSVESIDEKTGIVVEKENVDDLIKVLKMIKSDNLESKFCMERSKLFSKESKYQEYINLYQSVLNI